ncbi:MAG: phosphoglycerate kinase [Anaerolineales bacterium]
MNEFNKKTIKDIDLKEKRVLVRVDFNVPIQDGKVGDDTRIKAALPTVEYLLDKNAALILTSHLGRPKGKFDPALSLLPVAEYLDQLLDTKVTFVEDCLGKKPEKAVKDLEFGEVLLLENTRFHEGEKQNDPGMAKELAGLAELFVNDAFGTAHRSHASNVGVAQYLPAVAGFLLEKEIKYLGKTIRNPEHPFVSILGGAKVQGKIKVIRNLIDKVDKILIGGGIANTFFLAKGYQLGDSLVEEDVVGLAEELIKEAGKKLILPKDVVIADGFKNEAEKKTISVSDVPDGWQILDIGNETINMYGDIIRKAKTVVWNGPMGVFEFQNFAIGTFRLAELLSESKATSIVGGGDSASAIRKAGLVNQVTHISTGGGASLQMLQGEILPGLDALDNV